MSSNPTKDLISYVQGLVSKNSDNLLDCHTLFDYVHPQFQKLSPQEQYRFLLQTSEALMECQEIAQLVGAVVKQIVDEFTDEDWSRIGLQDREYGKQEVRYEVLQEYSIACERTEKRRHNATQSINKCWENEDWMARLNDEGLVNEGVWALNFTENLARLARRAVEYSIDFDDLVEKLKAVVEARKKRRSSRKCNDLIATDLTIARQLLEAEYKALQASRVEFTIQERQHEPATHHEPATQHEPTTQHELATQQEPTTPTVQDPSIVQEHETVQEVIQQLTLQQESMIEQRPSEHPVQRPNAAHLGMVQEESISEQQINQQDSIRPVVVGSEGLINQPDLLNQGQDSGPRYGE